MSNDQTSSRFGQPLVNGQTNDASSMLQPHTTQYNTSKSAVYTSEQVSVGGSNSPPSSTSGSTSSQGQSSGGAGIQRHPSGDSITQQRNFASSGPVSSSQSSNQNSSNAGQTYKSPDSYKSTSDSYKQTSDNYKQSGDSYKSSSDSYKTQSDPYKQTSDNYKTQSDPYKQTSDNYKTQSDPYKQTSDNYKTQSDPYKQTSDSYKSQSDPYKPGADSYKSTTDNYKPTSDSYKQSSSDSYKTSSDNYKSSSDGYKTSGDAYKSTPSSFGSGQTMTSAQGYKTEQANSAGGGANANAYKTSGDASAQPRPAPVGTQNTSAASPAQVMRKSETNRPIINNNNYQQSFQNQQRPASTTPAQPPATTPYQPTNASYQQSNYQQPSYQTQRPAATPTATQPTQLKRETSNTSMNPPRTASAYSTQNAQNQNNFQRATTTPANPTQAQRAYTPNQNLPAGQPTRPVSPVTTRPHPVQTPPGPKPQTYQQPSYQTTAATAVVGQRPNYQQSTAVPGRVPMTGRTGNPTTQQMYPNYQGAVRTLPASGTTNADIFQRAATASYQQRHPDTTLRLDQRMPMAGNRGSPLANFTALIEGEKRKAFQQSSAAVTPDSPSKNNILQNSKFKALIQKNIQPGEGDGPPAPFTNLNIRQNLVEETIGAYRKLENDAAKSLSRQQSAANNLVATEVVKKIKMKKIQNLLLKAGKEAGQKEKEEKEKEEKENEGKKKKKKKKRKKKDGEEEGAEGEEGGETGEGEEDEEEEEEEETDDDDEEYKPFVFKPPALKEGSGTVFDNIKFFEDNDTAKIPLTPKKPIKNNQKDKPSRPTNIPITPATESSAAEVEKPPKKVHEGSCVDETPMVHPNLRRISDTPLKVARINAEKKPDRRKSARGSGQSGNKKPNSGRSSYPGTPTKGNPTTPKQGVSAPETPKKSYSGVHRFNPEEELLSFFQNPAARSKFFKNIDVDHDSGVDEGMDRKDSRPTTNGDIGSPKKTPSKLPGPRKSAPAGSPTKTPLKSPGTAKSLPKTPESPAGPPLVKKVPMNRIQVGSAPSPNLKQVKSKIGSLANTTHKPGGGNIRIESHKVDFRNAQARIANKNDTYTPGGGDKKIQQVKLQWSAKPKVGSMDNATHKPGGGDKKIENVKLDFKDKAKPKVGSKDNAKHTPGGGVVKNSPSPLEGKSPNTLVGMRWAMVRSRSWRLHPIENQKLEFKVQSKIGSLDNVKHRPGGGDVKIFDDKMYLKQVSGGTDSRGSGTQSYSDLSVVTEVHGNSKPGTPNTAIKIKKTTTIGKPDLKKTTEVTVVSRSPSKERKPIAKSPSTQEIKLTYSKVQSPAKQPPEAGAVQVVNVPAKEHAPILKPSVEIKEAGSREIKDIIQNFESHITSGKESQSAPSAGTDGKRHDVLPNVVPAKQEPSPASQQNAKQKKDDAKDGDKEESKSDKNNKNDENIRKSSLNPEVKAISSEESPVSKFLQNEIAAHEKVGEIWKEVQNTTGVTDKTNQVPKPVSGQQPAGPVSAAPPAKLGYPNNPLQQPQQQQQQQQQHQQPPLQQHPQQQQQQQQQQQHQQVQPPNNNTTQPRPPSAQGSTQPGPMLKPMAGPQPQQNPTQPSMLSNQQTPNKQPAAGSPGPPGLSKPQPPPAQQPQMKPMTQAPLQQGQKYSMPQTQTSSSPGGLQSPLNKPHQPMQSNPSLARMPSELSQSGLLSQQQYNIDKNVPKDSSNIIK